MEPNETSEDGMPGMSTDPRSGLKRAEFEYLGDSVYAGFDGFGVWLAQCNGGPLFAHTYMEPKVIEALNRFIQYKREQHGNNSNTTGGMAV